MYDKGISDIKNPVCLIFFCFLIEADSNVEDNYIVELKQV